MDNTELLDFDNENNEVKKSLYSEDYDNQTKEFYRVLRQQQTDPIIEEKLELDKCFKFPYIWDPYTGERKGLDPYGPLCFHPDVLIKYYYSNRLNGLWIKESDEDGGYYQGMYGEYVGIGEDMNIKSRGTYADQYVFRLPITDCYLIKKCDMSIPTMGPKLTVKEIIEIQKLAEKYYKNNYRTMFNMNRPNLYHMKTHYDNALTTKPDFGKDTQLYNSLDPVKDANKMLELQIKYNRNAVDMLVKM